MSLTRLYKLRMIGVVAAKEAVLEELQTLGCLMLVPTRTTEGASAASPHRRVYEALAFLLSCPRRRPQIRDESGFDAEQLQRSVLELQRKLQDLEDERDAVVQRLRDLEPWGNFDFPAPRDMGGATPLVLRRAASAHAAVRGRAPSVDVS